MRCWRVPTQCPGIWRHTRHIHRTPVCAAVKTHIADRPLHQLPDGRLICPIIGPLDDESLPFAVALELSPASHEDTAHNTNIHDEASSTTYALSYVLEGRGQFAIPTMDAFPQQHHEQQPLVQDVQAGDTILAPTGMGQYIPTTPEAHPGSLARLLMVLPKEVFTAHAQHDTGAHMQSYQSVIKTWEQWQACHTVGTLTHEDVHRLLSRRQRPILHDDALHTSYPATSAQEPTPTAVASIDASIDEADDDEELGRYPVHHHHPLVPSLAAWHTALVESSHALLDSLNSVVLPFPSLASFTAHFPSHASHHAKPLIIKRALDDLETFRLPNQTNVLALVFDPLQHPVPFTFGVEIFQASHKTPPHMHPNAHEMFFILAGEGEGFCDGHRFPVGPGDLLLFPPKSVHGIDVGAGGKMYCLEFMLPNEMFAEFVRRGALSGLHDDDLCQLNVISC